MNTWTDKKGRSITISSMSNRWLKNILRYAKDKDIDVSNIKNEIKRRKSK